MPSLRELGKKYIWGITEPIKSKIMLGDESSYGFASGESRYNVSTLDAEMLRKIALREPLIYGAICKKNKDTLRNGIKIRPIKDDGKVPQTDLGIINDFNTNTRFLNKLEIAGRCANIYGNGYIERTFLEGGKSDTPVDEYTEPLGLNLLNPEFINDYKSKKKGDKQKYYFYKDSHGNKLYIHPDRIIDIATDRLPHSHFGTSKIHILANVLKSKMGADITSGETLNWFGHGIPALKIQNMNDEQKKKAIEYFNTHPDYFVFDQDYELDIQNPARIDPKPFYDYFFVNIARAMEMPTHMLTGVQPGHVTGSEVGISDYYHDIENIQKTVFTPILEDVYSQLLKAHGRAWKYKILWNPIFLDELSEARILEKRTLIAVQGKINGLIDVEEARRIMNDGVIFLDPAKKIKKDKPAISPPFLPNVEPNKPKRIEDPDRKKIIKPLTPIQKEMIRRERELGEEILREQERREIDANKIKRKTTKSN